MGLAFEWLAFSYRLSTLNHVSQTCPQSWSTGCFFVNASLKQDLHTGLSLLLPVKLYPPRKLIQGFKTHRNVKKAKTANQLSFCKTYHCTAMTMVTSVRMLRRNDKKLSESHSQLKKTFVSSSSRKLETSQFFLWIKGKEENAKGWISGGSFNSLQCTFLTL